MPGFEQNWQGIVALARTPRPVIERLNLDIARALGAPATTELLSAQGLDPVTSTPVEFDQLIRAEIAKWQAAGIRIDWRGRHLLDIYLFFCDC